MRKVLIILLLAALALGTLGAVLFLIRGRAPAAPPAPPGPSPETVERARTELDAEVEACAGDAKCVEEATMRHAVLAQIASLCGAIEDAEARDECVRAVALRQTNVQICDGIEDAERAQACRDAVRFKTAQQSGDPKPCGDISSETLAQTCFTSAVGEKTDRALCGGFAERAGEICLAVIITNEAAASQDESKCDEIQDEFLRNQCAAQVSARLPFVPLDTDGDGLSDEDERKYGTDVNSPDTDGDGFDDGTEVKNGFNPLGAGRL